MAEKAMLAGNSTMNIPGESFRLVHFPFARRHYQPRVDLHTASAVHCRLSDGDETSMMRYLCEIGEFVRSLRIQARFGELSRAPLQLLRLELRKGIAECDWIARPPDQWDLELQLKAAERNASLQALKDAIEIRDLLFRVLPDLYSAVFRVYRQSADEKLTLISVGTVGREQRAPVNVRSVAMRAKLLGLRFWMNEEILESLPPEECAVNL